MLVLDPAQGYDGVPQGAGRAPDGRWFIDLSALLPDGQRLHPGETTSGRTLTIYNANDRRVDYTPGAGGAVPANSAPAFETEPALAAEVGQPYSYDAHGTDADGEAVYYFLASGPAGMTVGRVPFFSFSTHNVPCTANPLGIKGAGEAGAVGAPPAVINAVVDALNAKSGKRSIDMPAIPRRVWEALHGSVA